VVFPLHGAYLFAPYSSSLRDVRPPWASLLPAPMRTAYAAAEGSVKRGTEEASATFLGEARIDS